VKDQDSVFGMHGGASPAEALRDRRKRRRAIVESDHQRFQIFALRKLVAPQRQLDDHLVAMRIDLEEQRGCSFDAHFTETIRNCCDLICRRPKCNPPRDRNSENGIVDPHESLQSCGTQHVMPRADFG
jgi:hypothetical protein